jgi:hypothetical protein
MNRKPIYPHNLTPEPEMMKAIMGGIIKKLKSHNFRADMEELESLAGYGIAKARTEWDGEKMGVDFLAEDFNRRAAAWFVGIGYRRAIDMMRSTGDVSRIRGGRVIRPRIRASELNTIDADRLPACSSANGTDSIDAADLVAVARRELTGRELDVFDMIFIEGLTAAETARRLGISHTTINSTLDRVVARLRELVG